LADVWLARIAAALLRRGAMVHALSAALTIGAVLGGSVAVAFGWHLVWPVAVVVALIGLVEFWLAMRVAVDADLFSTLGDGDLARFDEAMGRLELMPGGKAGRPMEVRIRGALRLLKLQAMLLLLQIVTLFASSILIR